MIVSDSSGYLWIATENGLNKFDPKSEKFTRYLHEPDNDASISGNIVRTIYVDSKNTLWIGTHFGGVCSYDTESDSFIRHQADGIYHSVFYEDSKGILWKGSITGLSRFDSGEQRFVSIPLVENDKTKSKNKIVTSIIEDLSGELWVGTTVNLLKYDRAAEVFRPYSKEDGLNNSAIASISVDNTNNLWVSTALGISSLNPETDVIQNYTLASFNRNSHFKSRDGSIFMGSLDGLYHFDPAVLQDNQTPPQTVITSFKIFNNEAQLTQNISVTDSITLHYTDNFFSFEFAALDYSDPSRNRYRYTLEGFDNQWNEVGSERRFAGYTNLDGGEYRFVVTSSNNDGVWNEEGTSIVLSITPPFNETTTFILLVILVVLVIILLVITYIMKLNMALKSQKNSEQRQKELRSYLTNIIDSMPSILIGVNENCEVTMWNKSAEIKTTLNRSEALGREIAALFSNWDEKLELIKKSLYTATICSKLNSVHIVDKKTVYENFIVYPLVTTGVAGAVIRIDDITHERELEEQLNHSRKKDAIGQLAGGVAHDFNNMLAGILGAAQLLKESSDQLSESDMEFMDIIIQSSQRAADLTHKLLAFGRKGKLLTAAVDIKDIINDTAAILKRTLDRKIEIVLQNTVEHSVVLGDASSLQNAIINLCINASHAMEDGGPLTLSSENTVLNSPYCSACTFDIEPGEYVHIQVRDTGTGIEKENLKRIFEPFFTTKEVGKGTGLGLAAVYGTVKEHKGALTVYSEIGEGTVFHIYLPSSEGTSEDFSVTEVESGSGMILLVDDEEVIRQTGMYILERLGYSVQLATTGKEALEIYMRDHELIDLIIIDMIMPELNGKETFSGLKRIDPDCKVVLSSGFSKKEDVDVMKKEGLLGFLKKPFNISELSSLLKEILG